MALEVGIVGLPNSGKTTIFNALTHVGAEITAYASVTEKPNVGMAAILDQRLERLGQPARIVLNRPAGVEVVEQGAQLVDLPAQCRVAGLRLLLDSLQPPLDVVAVGDEQLELEVLQIPLRIRTRREAVEHDEQRIHLAERTEQRRAGARNVLHADRGRGDLLR